MYSTGQEYEIDKLVNNEDPEVRLAAAKQGYGLDKLVYDKNYIVRIAVVEQNYRLPVLVHDKSIEVRKAVIKQGYGLGYLSDDESSVIRIAVAEKAGELGREDILEKLSNDKDEHVREAAIEQIKKKSDASANNVTDVLSGIASKISGK